MSVKMKLGIWEDRFGRRYHVNARYGRVEYAWGSSCGRMWTDSGHWNASFGESEFDLVRFISDLPGTASAESGAAGSPTVSTGDPQQTLRRMRKTESAMRAEAQAHHDAYEAVTRAADDLEAEIIRLEKEVDG